MRRHRKTAQTDELLTSGAYAKGRKKYARGGKAMARPKPLEEQAAEAVGYDVWFTLEDTEKAELVEELVKSGTIVPTASDTDMRILELIQQNEYADTFADGGETHKPFFRDRTAKLREPFNKGFEGLAKATGHGSLTKLARGGFDVGHWYRDSSGEEFKYIGDDGMGSLLFNDGTRVIKKPLSDFDEIKEEKLFGWFADGGVATAGKFKVKFYLKESPESIKEKIFDDKDKADLFFETIQDDEEIVVLPMEEVKEEVKASKPKNLFAAAKPVPATKAAAKKRERVEVDGISSEIARYDELKAIINNAKAEQEIIGGRLKEIGRDKFLDLYEERGFRPANFDLADGNENILLEVTDKYLKVEPEKAAILEQFDGLLEVKTTYEFNPDILEKQVSDTMTVGDVVSMLIQDSNLLSDSDKENLIKAKTTTRVPKGTIDRLLDYDNPREVFNLIAPILALK